MFSCMGDPDVATNASSDKTLTHIVQESEKLRTKCRSLRTLLLETETKRCEEMEAYENQIAHLKQELDSGIAELRTQNFTQVRNTVCVLEQAGV
jgi:hypothetical protein